DRVARGDHALTSQRVELTDTAGQDRDVQPVEMIWWRPADELVRRDHHARTPILQQEGVHVRFGKRERRDPDAIDLHRLTVRDHMTPDDPQRLHVGKMRVRPEHLAEILVHPLRDIDVRHSPVLVPLGVTLLTAQIPVQLLEDAPPQHMVRVPVGVEAGADPVDPRTVERYDDVVRRIEEDVRPVDERCRSVPRVRQALLPRLVADPAMAPRTGRHERPTAANDLDLHHPSLSSPGWRIGTAYDNEDRRLRCTTD